MEIILTKDIKALGEAGKLVKVKPGYARNYLLPNGFAIYASPKNLSKIEEIKKIAADEKIALYGKYKEVIDKIEVLNLHLSEKLMRMITCSALFLKMIL